MRWPVGLWCRPTRWRCALERLLLWLTSPRARRRRRAALAALEVAVGAAFGGTLERILGEALPVSARCGVMRGCGVHGGGR